MQHLSLPHGQHLLLDMLQYNAACSHCSQASLCFCSIPACLMGSTSLEELYLGDNSLHGTIPALAQGSLLTAFLAPDQEVRPLQSLLVANALRKGDFLSSTESLRLPGNLAH